MTLKRLSPSLSAPRLLLLIMAAVLLAIASPVEAKKKDHTPPTFTGLNFAVACIAGPIGGGRTTSYHLSWDPAKDNATPSSAIVYDVYQATIGRR